LKDGLSSPRSSLAPAKRDRIADAAERFQWTVPPPGRSNRTASGTGEPSRIFQVIKGGDAIRRIRDGTDSRSDAAKPSNEDQAIRPMLFQPDVV